MSITSALNAIGVGVQALRMIPGMAPVLDALIMLHKSTIGKIIELLVMKKVHDVLVDSKQLDLAKQLDDLTEADLAAAAAATNTGAHEEM